MWSRGNVDQFDVKENGDFTWEHIDPGEGFKLRIIYTGNTMQKVYLTGYAVGIGEVLDSQRQQETMRKVEQGTPWWIILVFVLIPASGDAQMW
jgi:hypothetical protein